MKPINKNMISKRQPQISICWYPRITHSSVIGESNIS